MMNISDKIIFGNNNLKKISESKDFASYRLDSDGGYALFDCYDVFSGVKLVYYDIRMKCFEINYRAFPELLEINCCFEGRMECETEDEFHYMVSGDFSVSKNDGAVHKIFCPFKKSRGVVIHTDIAQAPGCFSCFMDDVNVKPDAIMEKFCKDIDCALFRSDGITYHVFSELYSVPESVRKGYFKVKILELFLLLSGMDLDNANKKNCAFSKPKVELAKSAGEYLLENMERRVTIAELAEHFHVSPTSMKNCFKDIYGDSVYSYIRGQKMNYAASMLKETDLSILEIAGSCGYDNGSKFASSFRAVMGMAPNEYRNSVSPGQNKN